MTTPLTAADFAGFFDEVHGFRPFPWQDRLLHRLAATAEWPPLLDLPTGSGKTAALDIAVFHLALDALEFARGGKRKAPIRIVFAVDRRLIVDDAFERARKIANALIAPKGPVTQRVAAALRTLAGGEGPPLLARRLRGGVPREDDWARTPVQPTILCSTVDQVGSRLLFRGYGVSDRMKPVHAGLLGTDCLILLDEAHLAEPFRQTLEAVKRIGKPDGEKGPSKRDPEENWDIGVPPLTTAVLTATPGARSESPFGLEDDDRADLVLARRLQASKPALLIDIVGKQGVATEDRRVEEIVEQTKKALSQLRETLPQPVIGVVVNRVLRARRIFDRLRQGECPDAEVTLLIGPAREVDRNGRAHELDRIRTGNETGRRNLEKPFIVVATQTIEAGVDLDFDALITEAAPLDALRQRFGRLNRDGRPFTAFAAILAHRDDIALKADDPVYGDRTGKTWRALQEAAGQAGFVDFGIDAFPPELLDNSDELASKKKNAPIVMPAYAHLWSQTWPIPNADPDVPLFLHGPDRSPITVQIAWRADLFRDRTNNETIELLRLVPPKPGEMVEVSLAAARRWLRNTPTLDFADAPERGSTEDAAGEDRLVFRWAGPDDAKTGWLRPGRLAPNDVIVAPADYGGCDKYGWKPESGDPVEDVGRQAAEPFAAHRYALRLTPELISAAAPPIAGSEDASAPEKRAAVARFKTAFEALIAELDDQQRVQGTAIVSTLLDAKPPPEFGDALTGLLHRRRDKHHHPQVLFPYGEDLEEHPRGIILVAPKGIRVERQAKTKVAYQTNEEFAGGEPATEDDGLGSTPGYDQSLEDHSREVRCFAQRFGERAGLNASLAADVALGAFLHDAGKADPRFQAMLYGGKWLAVDEGTVLAKSAAGGGQKAWKDSGLPERWRHEALSVRIARAHRLFDTANDRELVLWLIGVHHGYGRPFFPHSDELAPRDLPPVLGGIPVADGPGPQSLGFNFDGYDWSQMFHELKTRYGIWGLATLEAFVRLADHRASEAAGLAERAP